MNHELTCSVPSDRTISEFRGGKSFRLSDQLVFFISSFIFNILYYTFIFRLTIRKKKYNKEKELFCFGRHTIFIQAEDGIRDAKDPDGPGVQNQLIESLKSYRLSFADTIIFHSC